MDELIYLRPDQLVPWPELNPRRRFDEAKVAELKDSIAENGVLQNLVVHETDEDVKWIVAGETRWRAGGGIVEGGGEVMLPCRIRKFTEAQALKIAMLENLQRNSLTPIEEAIGFRHYLELNPEMTQEQLAAEFDKSQSYVSNRIRLLELPEPIQVAVDEGRVAPSYARDLLLPWMQESEAIRDRFFRVILSQIQLASGFDEPVTKIWLEQAIEKIKGIVKPEKPKPAPSASKSKTTSSTKPSEKPASKPEPEPEAAPEAEAPVPGMKPKTPAPEAKDGGPTEEAGGDVGAAPSTAGSPAREPRPVTALKDIPAMPNILVKKLRELGIETTEQLHAHDLTWYGGQKGFGATMVGILEQVMKDHPAPAAEPPAPPAAAVEAADVAGMFGRVAGLAGRYRVQVLAADTGDGQISLTMTPTAVGEGLPPVPPVVVRAAAAEVDQEFAARFPELLERLRAQAAA